MFSKIKILLSKKQFGLVFITWVICLNGFTQCPTHQQFWDLALNIESSQDDIDIRLQKMMELKTKYEKCSIEKDSVYARILHRIGAYHFQNSNYSQSIAYNIEAIKINKSGKRGSCIAYTANSYNNLARSYDDLALYNQALSFYDSAITIGKNLPSFQIYLATARLKRGNIFYKKGDFEKDIEETTLGLQTARTIKDTGIIIKLLLERCQSYEVQQKLSEGLADINLAIILLQNSNDYDTWANAYRYKADILADQHNCDEAKNLYKKAIAYRMRAGDYVQVAIDYNDAGTLLLDKCNNPDEANQYFTKAYNIALKAKAKNVCALASNNLAQIYFLRKNYTTAVKQYQLSLQLLTPNRILTGLTENPTHRELLGLDTKKNLEIILDNKSKSLLYLYKKTKISSYLKASLATALLADSIITDLRNEQAGEQSKLYWRNDTRDFFTRTLEACYLDNNIPLAFYFMEKSCAVLLNDKLAELGAANHIPAKESEKEEKQQINIIMLQQQLSYLEDTCSAYRDQQIKLLEAKENFEKYIGSLEQKYPLYFQYKFGDKVPSLNDLQAFLAKEKQCFIHYFIGDTVTYILSVSPNKTAMLRLSKEEFSPEQLAVFLHWCSDKQALNSQYNQFAVLSNTLYRQLFQKLQLPAGSVVICADNYLIPFEALTTDKEGKHFLIQDYIFSYVYSARFLLNKFSLNKAKGDFLGIAPVSFSPYLKVPDLLQSEKALTQSADNYNSYKILSKNKASSKNFLTELPEYTIVNIFSHASADSSFDEPILYMQDSVIRLSKLQLIRKPATMLVMLSACETNSGKNATGEGIYSLARGFASAGIPAVSATLWKADEQAVYVITAYFNKNLSLGMNKDEALQKAKLYYIQNNSGEKLLPYYWANMVLVGSTAPITLTSNNYTWLWAAFFGGLAIFIFLKIKKNGKNIP